MGFGFNLFVIFILLPLTVVLLVLSNITGKKIFSKTNGVLWKGIIALVVLSLFFQTITSKKELKKQDYYGEYIIDRDFFAGKQADWQYNNFRFTIKENDSIYFYVTDKQKKIRVYKGTISTTKPYNSERLRIKMRQPTHHILASNPTIYRSAWSFYLVFESHRFFNVYFRKGKWKSIE